MSRKAGDLESLDVVDALEMTYNTYYNMSLDEDIEGFRVVYKDGDNAWFEKNVFLTHYINILGKYHKVQHDSLHNKYFINSEIKKYPSILRKLEELGHRFE